MARKSFTEQIQQQNPFTQGQIMSDNIKAIIGNILHTLTLIFSLSSKLNLLGVPCSISKSFTKSICKINALVSSNINTIENQAQGVKNTLQTGGRLHNNQLYGGNINNDMMRVKKDLELLLKNTLSTFKEILKLRKNIHIKNMPCEAAKFITNKICLLSETMSTIKAIFPTETIDKLKGIMSGNITLSELDISDEADKLEQIIKDNNQKGGEMYRWDKIVNPNTGRYVNVTGKLGKKILIKYMEQLEKY
tara:strand:- start:843 stop:1589 length:747 start_codon:yes stop_codon:yes gene_type:complete